MERLASAEPAWLADERRRALARVRGAAGRAEPPVHAVRGPARRRARRTSSRPTPPTASAGRAGRPRRPTGSRPWPRSRRTGVASIVLVRRGAPGRRHASRRSTGWSAATPRRARRLIAGPTAPRPPTTSSRSSASRRGARASVVRVPAGVVLDAADRRPLGGRGAGPRAPRPHDRRARRRRRRRRWSRSSCRPTASSPGGQALFTATTEIRLGARRPARAWRASRSSAPTRSCSSSAVADLGDDADLRWALAQLGGRLVRSRVDNVLAGDRSTVEQVEIVFGADDQLHDLTSYTRHVGRDTTGPAAEQGRAARPGAELPQGPDHDREERDRHRQLPRRVRHEPLEVGSRRGDPVARDRPAGLPPRGPRVVGRPDRRDAAVLPREPGHPARRGAQVHRARASSSRSSRASRSRTPRTACARRSRRSGPPASPPDRDPAAPPPEPTTATGTA